MYSKKAQFTLFVILGLLVLITIFVSVYLLFSSVDEIELDVVSFANIENYFDTCFDNAVSLSVEDLLNDNLALYEGREVYVSDVNIPVVLLNDRAFFIGDNEVEDNLEDFIFVNSLDCFDIDFQENLGVSDFSLNSLDVSVSLGENNILVNHDLDASVSLGRGTSRDSWSFYNELDYPILNRIQLINNFLYNQQYEDSFLIGILSSSAVENDFSYDLVFSDNYLVITFVFPSEHVFYNDFTRTSVALKGPFSEVEI